MEMSDQFRVALYRALGSSLLIGLGTALTIWSQTDDIKTIVIGALTPVIGYLGTRFGVEGYVDTVAAKK